VTAHVRHTETPYDDLLVNGWAGMTHAARSRVRSAPSSPVGRPELERLKSQDWHHRFTPGQRGRLDRRHRCLLPRTSSSPTRFDKTAELDDSVLSTPTR
jgi:hypothetical protein